MQLIEKAMRIIKVKNEISKEKIKNKVVYKLEDRLIKKQLDFIVSTSRHKIARCSRRAGKSTAIAYYLRDVASKGNKFNCGYLAKTKSAAVKIIWDVLLEIIEEAGDDVKINRTDHFVYFIDTKSYIWLFGADNSKDIEKLRGVYYKLFVIDEAQMFPSYLKKLMYEVVEPALGDLQGTLCLTGTPNATCSGVFFDTDHNVEWDRHYWTWRDNHYFWQKAMANNDKLTCPEDIKSQALKARGLSESDAAARREWDGEWVKSDDLQVYKYSDLLCDYTELPTITHTVIGVDLGFNDHDAIVVIGYNKYKREVYLIEEYKENKQAITPLINKLKELSKRYNPYYMCVDGGGLGKKIAEEINSRNEGIFLDSAQKTDKFAYIELLNDDMRRGFIKIKRDSMLAGEMKVLTYSERHYEEQSKFVEESGLDNHLCDSFLYAWRYVYAHFPQDQEVKIDRNSEEYVEHLINKQIENDKKKEKIEEYNDYQYNYNNREYYGD